MSKKSVIKYRKAIQLHTHTLKIALKRDRMDFGLSQDQASEITGVSQQTISNWENLSKPNVPTVAEYFAYSEAIAHV